MTYEVASSTEWAFGKFSPLFTPDTFVDISNYVDQKFRALEIYGSELREFPHPRSIEEMALMAKDRGSRVGVDAAEAFMTIWRRI
jgi:LmbE family N-acetylglucosaminyl deacetylase